MCWCICVSICVYVSVCLHVFLRIYTCVSMRARVCVCVCGCMRTCLYPFMRVCVRTRNATSIKRTWRFNGLMNPGGGDQDKDNSGVSGARRQPDSVLLQEGLGRGGGGRGRLGTEGGVRGMEGGTKRDGGGGERDWGGVGEGRGDEGRRRSKRDGVREIGEGWGREG